MVADRQHKAQAQGVLSRSGPAIAVIGIHVILIYAISASMGIVPIPSFIPASEIVLIPETIVDSEPDPIVEPEIEPLTEHVPVDVPLVPQIEEEVAPVDTSATSIDATPIVTPAAAGAPAQQLQAKQRVEPAYPPGARRDGEEGTVRLRVFVNERGQPGEVQVAKSSGFARLDDAAANAVRRWRFQAATDGSRAISAWTQVAITFKLTETEKR
jgi:protein TonB